MNALPEARKLVDIPHVARMVSGINVSLCVVLATKAGSREVVVFNDLRSHVALDLRIVVDAVAESMSSVYQWAKIRKAVMLKEHPRSHDDDEYPLIQNVGSPPKRRRAASSSSLALAPLGQLLEIDADGVRSTIRALRGIERQQAAIGDHVRREDVHAACSEDISRALASGSLVATVSDSGEQALRINRSSVQWSVAFLLGRPLQLSRVSRGGDPLKLCELDVLVRLHADGWRPRPSLAGAWEPGMALEYTAGLKQPLSYFAALLDQNAVFGKGVTSIVHSQKDGYCRCLLRLCPAALARMHAEMFGQSNYFFLKCLRDTGGDRIDEEDADVSAAGALSDSALAMPPLSVGYGEVALVPAAIVTSSLWTRKLIDCGAETMELKVYFDHCTHQSGRQRGWVDCVAHACIRYKFCTGRQRVFLADMYAWQLAGPICTAGGHLAHCPTQEDLAAVMADLRASGF